MKVGIKIGKILLAVGLAIAVILLVILLNFNSVIKNSLEQSITKSLGVQAAIAELKLNPMNGNLEINGLEISNPEGFSTPKFLQIQNFAAQVNTSSLLSNTVELGKLHFKDISINIEQQFPRNNVTEIFAGGQKHTQSDEAKTEKKFRLSLATINNLSLKLSLTQFGTVLGSTTANLPSAELKDVNSENVNSLLMSEVITKLLGSTFNTIFEKNKANIPKPIIDLLKQQKVISNKLPNTQLTGNS